MAEYILKYGDPDRLEVKTFPSGENIDNYLDKLSTTQILNIFFRVHEDVCERNHYA